ncbi:MAG: M28 family peptidase [Planctomycetota bacterium]
MDVASLLGELHPRVDPEAVLSTAREIQRIDRLFSFHSLGQSARLVLEALRVPPIEARLHEFPTTEAVGDGRRVIREAWDVESAVLRACLPGGEDVLLADLQRDPFSVVSWSAPSADSRPAPLRVIDDPAHLAQGGVEGRFVLTKSDDRSFHYSLCEAGVRGIIVDGLQPRCPDAKKWLRFGWSGWPAWCRRRTLGFSLSHNEGRSLRELLARNADLRVAAEVKSRFYRGVLPVVDAVLPGKTNEEVLLVAHLFEPGAIDNASGCAAVVHAMRLLAELVSSSRIERPGRSIRAILSYELFGIERLFREVPDVPVRTRALVCVDGAAASAERSLALPTLKLSSPACPTALDALAAHVVGALDATGVAGAPFSLTDRDYYLDDAVANRVRSIPGVSFTAQTQDPTLAWFVGYHSSFDTPDLLEPALFRDVVAAVAATALGAADLGPSDAPRLASLCEELARAEVARWTGSFRRLARDAKNPLGAAEELALHEEMLRRRLESVDLLIPGARPTSPSRETVALLREAYSGLRQEIGPGCERPGEASAVSSLPDDLKAEAAGVIPIRLLPDIPCFETIAGHGDLRGAFGRDDLYTPILDACDGARSILSAWRLALRCGSPPPLAKVLDAFRLLADLGFVRLRSL